MSEPTYMVHGPLTTTAPCLVHGSHRPRSWINHRHHVWPLGMGGPDIPENLVIICASGHGNVHCLLAMLVDRSGQVEPQVLAQFARSEQALAALGYRRWLAGSMDA